ncbi:MAG: magnesium chelatase, partial [Spirochaetaceae bacterium]|nr:magnesium chelatase [Spirochaetaceae bacterium]
LPTVELSDELWDMIVAYAARGGVQGHRADIVMAKAASALAALNGRDRVRQEDVQEAARLALPHRLSGRIDDTPESSADRLEELIGGQELPDLDAPPEGEIDRQPPQSFDPASSFEGRSERSVDPLDELQVPGSAAAGSIVFDFLKKKSPH